MQYRKITRRFFLKGIGALGILLGSSELVSAENNAECLSASNHSKETMLAIADAVVPNAKSLSDKSPGAADACPLDIIYDPYFGLEKYIFLFVISIDWSSIWRYGRFYKNLDFEKRTSILQLKEEKSWFLKRGFMVLIILTKAAFYGGYKNKVGLEYIGFPGESPGYYSYSHNIVFAKERSSNGNLK